MKKPEMNPVYRRRLWIHRVGIALSFFAMAIGLFFLMWILLTLVRCLPARVVVNERSITHLSRAKQWTLYANW